jgi:hypothetical protein
MLVECTRRACICGVCHFHHVLVFGRSCLLETQIEGIAYTGYKRSALGSAVEEALV